MRHDDVCVGEILLCVSVCVLCVSHWCSNFYSSHTANAQCNTAHVCAKDASLTRSCNRGLQLNVLTFLYFVAFEEEGQVSRSGNPS